MREIITIFIVLISYNLLAQDKNGQENLIESTNPRLTNPLGLNLNIGGPSFLLSCSADYFITSSLNIEAGIGYLGLFGGIKYHSDVKDDKNWSPYLGLYVVNVPGSYGDDERNGLYIPLGSQYISNKGFTFGIEVAATIINDINWITENRTNVWGAVKLGYHFHPMH